MCSDAEVGILRSVEELATKIEGKMTNNETVPKMLALAKPGECSYVHKVNNFYTRETCYAALGFASGLAKCWAHADGEESAFCGYLCKPRNPNWWNLNCQQCLAKVSRRRAQCSFEYMHISEACQRCKLSAQDYHDNTCRMQCLDAFNRIDDASITSGCRQCTTDVENMMYRCAI